MSDWLTIPYSIGLDYMHMCLLGTTKYTINLLLLSSNHKEPFYIGNSSSCSLFLEINY